MTSRFYINPLALSVFAKALCVSTIVPISVLANEAPSFPLEIVVTASRMAETANETLAPVTVITQADIVRRQPSSLQDLLNGELGLSIANNGGAGKATSFFLRGTESDHVLVLIDGIKIGSATSGSSPFEHLPVDQIERIEIVRGPRSSLYGSDAIGGVIQIFTRKGGKGLKHVFSAGYGSNDTSTFLIGTRGGSNNRWFNLSLSGKKTAGFNACSGSLSQGCRTIEPDNDGYENLSATARLGYRFANNTEIDGHVLATNGASEYDGSSSNESKVENRVAGIAISFEPTEIWKTTFRLGQSQDHSETLLNGDFRTRFVTTRTTASLKNDVIIDDLRFVLGADYHNDEIDSTTVYAETERSNNAVFAQLYRHINRHDVQLALRYDDNQQFGSHATGSVAWGYGWHNDLRLTSTYSTAFKAPSFNELYFPGYGNDQLKPEQSRNLEMGLSGYLSVGRWSLNVFENRVDQLIAYDASIFSPGNISFARIRGVEAALLANISDWSVRTNITLLDPEHRGDDANKGNTLPRRAKETLRIDIHHAGTLDTGVTLIAQGERYDDLANTRKLGGYATVDLTASYQMNKHWKLMGKIENIFDKQYQTASFYNQADRGLFFSIHYQPEHN